MGVGLDWGGRLCSRSIYGIHKGTHRHLLSANVLLWEILHILAILPVLTKNSAFGSLWRFFNSKSFWNFNRGFCLLHVEFFHQIWGRLGWSETVHVCRCLHLLCVSWCHCRFYITSSPIFDWQVRYRVFETNLSRIGNSLFRCLWIQAKISNRGRLTSTIDHSTRIFMLFFWTILSPTFLTRRVYLIFHIRLEGAFWGWACTFRSFGYCKRTFCGNNCGKLAIFRVNPNL